MNRGSEIAKWRKLRKISQMDLAYEAGVSPKHISFLETGKTNGSRKLLFKIFEILNIPFEHRKFIAESFGFAYEQDLRVSQKEQHEILQVVQTLLKKQEPFPSVALNAAYDFLGYNKNFQDLTELFLGKDSLENFSNIIELIFAENGLRDYFADLETIEAVLRMKIEKEAEFFQSRKLKDLLKLMGGETKEFIFEQKGTLPVLTFLLKKDDVELEFFSIVSTFGTALDFRTKDIRIETLYPADEKTKEFISSSC